MFPLISVSTVILELPSGRNRSYSSDEIGNMIAGEKKKTKNARDKISVTQLGQPIPGPKEKWQSSLFQTNLKSVSGYGKNRLKSA